MKLLALARDRWFLFIAGFGLLVYLATGYFWLLILVLDPLIMGAAFGIWLLNLVLAVASYARLPSYSYLFLASPLLILALLFAILLDLR